MQQDSPPLNGSLIVERSSDKHPYSIFAVFHFIAVIFISSNGKKRKSQGFTKATLVYVQGN